MILPWICVIILDLLLYYSPWRVTIWHKLVNKETSFSYLWRELGFQYSDAIYLRAKSYLVVKYPLPWCMPGSLTSVFFVSRWWWKRSRHSRRMPNPTFCVPAKRPMTRTRHGCFCDVCEAVIWVNAFIDLMSPNSVYLTVVFIKNICDDHSWNCTSRRNVQISHLCPQELLIHWGRVTHICVSKLLVTGSDYGFVGPKRLSGPKLEYFQYEQEQSRVKY